MNSQLRQAKFRYSRRLNVRSVSSAVSVSTLLGILKPTFIYGSIMPNNSATADEHPVCRPPARSGADLLLRQDRSDSRWHTQQYQFRFDLNESQDRPKVCDRVPQLSHAPPYSIGTDRGY